MDQHEEYHKSPEWFNLWLIYCKKYQPNNPDAKLEPFEITEPSKYKPSPENCIPMTPRVSEWDLTWDERDNAAKKPVEDKGQLISEWLLDFFIWTKNRTKIFRYFCPPSLKLVQSKKECKLLFLFVFWLKWKHQRVFSEINWPLCSTYYPE